MNTKGRILTEAVKLFARDGFDAVTVEMIAEAVGIKAPSLYKHFRSKRDVFDSILKEMERRDAENAAGAGMPLEPLEDDGKDVDYSADQNDNSDEAGSVAEQYDDVDIPEFLEYCRKMFRYWTEDEFASSFRKMLTVEQFKSQEMNALYNQYLGTGPLGYTADIVGSEEAALALYGPMYMLYSVFDEASNKNAMISENKAYGMLDKHLNDWYRTYGHNKN